jgi:hypothetical protein
VTPPAAGSALSKKPDHGEWLDEPATAITDWVMALCASVWAALLIAEGGRRGAAGWPTLLWGIAFAATALAALLGGIVHGFGRRLGKAGAQRFWMITVQATAAASLALGAATVLVFSSPLVRIGGLSLAGAKWIWVASRLAHRPAFRVALADAAITLGVVLLLQLAAWWHSGASSLPWIAAGIALSGVAGTIQARGIAPHPRFNHNDLFHVVQIAALWVLYRGGLLLNAD